MEEKKDVKEKKVVSVEEKYINEVLEKLGNRSLLDVSDAELVAAWKAVRRQRLHSYHPDKNKSTGAEEIFKAGEKIYSEGVNVTTGKIDPEKIREFYNDSKRKGSKGEEQKAVNEVMEKIEARLALSDKKEWCPNGKTDTGYYSVNFNSCMERVKLITLLRKLGYEMDSLQIAKQLHFAGLSFDYDHPELDKKDKLYNTIVKEIVQLYTTAKAEKKDIERAFYFDMLQTIVPSEMSNFIRSNFLPELDEENNKALKEIYQGQVASYRPEKFKNNDEISNVLQALLDREKSKGWWAKKDAIWSQSVKLYSLSPDMLPLGPSKTDSSLPPQIYKSFGEFMDYLLKLIRPLLSLEGNKENTIKLLPWK